MSSASPARPARPARPVARHLRAVADRPYVRLAVLSAGAAAVAYGLASVLPNVSAVVAAITALIAVRPTLHSSMQEAMRQVVGVVIGAAVAYASLEMVGFSVLSLFVALVASFVAAAVLRLGEDAAVVVAVTVVLVVGPSFSTEAVEARLYGVLLGVLIAMPTSYFMRPGSPHGRALADVVAAAESTAALLAAIADALERSDGQIPARQARAWLGQAEETVGQIVEARRAAEDAVEGARWSPLIKEHEAEAVLEQVRISEGTAYGLVDICRDLLTAAERGEPLPAELAGSLSGVLGATAEAVRSQSTAARERPAQTLSEHTGPIGVARQTRTDAAAHVRHLDDTRPLLLGGSLLRDAEKITEILSGR